MVISPKYLKASMKPHFVEGQNQLAGTAVTLTQRHPGSLLTRPVARPGWPPSPGRYHCWGELQGAVVQLQEKEPVKPACSCGGGWNPEITSCCLRVFFLKSTIIWTFPGGPGARTPRSQCSGLRFDPWSGN